MESKQEWLSRLRATIEEVTPEEVARADNGEFVLVDVRESDEYHSARIAGAVHLPRGFLELRVEEKLPDRDRPIVAYCAGGVRSLFAADTLARLGYKNVRSMRGGFGGWKDAGLPFEEPRTLTEAEQRRYSRHLLIPEVGDEGQQRLLSARVLMVGAGGLGSPSAIYLAAAGVGTLGIIDDDVVEESNLQRQILHTTDRIGQSKVESARTTLHSINPGVNIETHEHRLDADNIVELFGQYDVIVDGSDNFETRYLVNDVCVDLELPNVHGSIFRFDGQVTVFWPGRGPCYRCLYAAPPPPELAPT